MAQRGIPNPRNAHERRRFSATLALALASHAALLLIDVRARQPANDRIPRAQPANVEVELREDEPTTGQPSLHSSPTAQAEPEARPLPRTPPAPRALSGAVAPGSGDTPALAEAASEAEGERQADLPRPGAPLGPHAGQTLTRDQLGLGTQNPFVGRAGPSAERGPELSRRVDRVLTEGIASADQRKGLGPEGPILAGLETETRNGLTPPNSSALFKIVTDGSGQLVGIDVIDANSEQRHWQEIGDRVRARLQKMRLRGTHGKRGLTFEIRVVSRVALPSGSDPGLEVDVLGIPIKKGDGKNSPRVSILDVLPKHTTQKVTLPDGRTIEVPMLSLDLLSIAADPADIGAPSRRMVHARLERLSAN